MLTLIIALSLAFIVNGITRRKHDRSLKQWHPLGLASFHKTRRNDRHSHLLLPLVSTEVAKANREASFCEYPSLRRTGIVCSPSSGAVKNAAGLLAENKSGEASRRVPLSRCIRPRLSNCLSLVTLRIVYTGADGIP